MKSGTISDCKTVLEMLFHNMVRLLVLIYIDVEDVMNVIASRKWNINLIITHEFSKDDITNALELAEDFNRVLNVIIEYE